MYYKISGQSKSTSKWQDIGTFADKKFALKKFKEYSTQYPNCWWKVIGIKEVIKEIIIADSKTKNGKKNTSKIYRSEKRAVA
jgi:NDP-sugar pyrophosphorylase family protein